jgi:ParB family transcriptional regulator, chromosome partitioning protein
VPVGIALARRQKKRAVHAHHPTKVTTMAAEPPFRASGDAARLTAAVVHIIDQDGPEAVDRLVRAAGTPQFDHVVSQLRCERAGAQALAQATAHYTERGFTILDEQQRWGWDPDRVPMRYLQRDGDDGEPAGVDESVIIDPQHWAVWLDEYTEYVDSDGNLVEEEQIDWDTADDADAEPPEGLRHADCVRERPAFAPDWFCLNPGAAGLQVSEMYQRNAHWYARQQRGQSDTASSDLDTDASDDRDAERAAARLRADAERRERRKVITLNKLGPPRSRCAAGSSPRCFPARRCRKERPRSWPTAWPATVTC